jgi:hypothetical protein
MQYRPVSSEEQPKKGHPLGYAHKQQRFFLLAAYF